MNADRPSSKVYNEQIKAHSSLTCLRKLLPFLGREWVSGDGVERWGGGWGGVGSRGLCVGGLGGGVGGTCLENPLIVA